MLESRASHGLGSITGYVMLLFFVVLDIAILWIISSEPITIATVLWALVLFISPPAFLFLIYWTSSLTSTRYRVIGNAFLIEWGRTRLTIPLTEIIEVVRGENLSRIRNYRGIRWPGYLVGYGQAMGAEAKERGARVYSTLFFSTRPLHQQLLVVTKAITYAISPRDVNNFEGSLEALLATRMTTLREVESTELSFINWKIWRDRPGQIAIALFATLNGLLFAFVAAVYNQLPANIPLHFTAIGVVDRTGPPISLFVLPLAGLVTWMINGPLGSILHQTDEDEPLAYVLWGATIVVQLATWIAVIGLLP